MNSANNKSSKTWQSPVCCLQKLVTGPKFTIFCQTYRRVAILPTVMECQPTEWTWRPGGSRCGAL